MTYVLANEYVIQCTVAYLGLCLRGGKTEILGKKRGRKRTHSHVSYQSQGGGKIGVRLAPSKYAPAVCTYVQ